METPNPIQTRACENCRHWVSGDGKIGGCRAFPPQLVAGSERGAWPVTGAAEWCSKFNPAVGSVGSVSKVSDEFIIGIVRYNSTTQKGAGVNGADLLPVATRRSDLVADIMEMGLSRTPALKRIEKLVRNGTFQQGESPWPRKGAAPGIHVWMDLDENAPKADEKPKTDDEGQFLALVRSVAFSAETAMSLRAIHREVEPHCAMSIATASRRMTPLVASGLVVKCDAGYYAPVVEVD